ncbi:MAG: hypothetical protein E6471_13785, partial [Bradyrhizobium sp.]|nr:hypothetical protein [Bradyrhizobium sp.]
MANERLPNERYPDGMNRPDMAGRPGMSRADLPGADITGAGVTGPEYERAARMDSRLQPDPELTEGRSSTGRIAAYALGIAILLGGIYNSGILANPHGQAKFNYEDADASLV